MNPPPQRSFGGLGVWYEGRGLFKGCRVRVGRAAPSFAGLLGRRASQLRVRAGQVGCSVQSIMLSLDLSRMGKFLHIPVSLESRSEMQRWRSVAPVLVC